MTATDRPDDRADEQIAQPCGRGICAANEGHEGTCAEASGFEEWLPAPSPYSAALDTAHNEGARR